MRRRRLADCGPASNARSTHSVPETATVQHRVGESSEAGAALGDCFRMQRTRNLPGYPGGIKPISEQVLQMILGTPNPVRIRSVDLSQCSIEVIPEISRIGKGPGFEMLLRIRIPDGSSQPW